jgi:hypothetical protein
VAATEIVILECNTAKQNEKIPIANLWHSSPSLAQLVRSIARKTDWLNRVIEPDSTKAPHALLGKIMPMMGVQGDLEMFSIFENDALAFELMKDDSLKFIHSLPHLNTLVIRGIANLLNDREGVTENQESAAKNASAFAFEILAKLEKTDVTNGNKGLT